MRVLVTGVARSGTSWVGQAFARAPRTAYVHEPDNRELDRYAGVAKRGLGVYGFYPVLAPGESAPAYATLWDLAFRGGWPDGVAWRGARRLAEAAPPALHIAGLTRLARLAARRPPAREHVVVKSVHCPMSLEWVAAHTGAAVVVVRRPVPEMVASWVERGFVPYPLDTIPQARERWLEPLRLPAPPAEPLIARLAWTAAVLDAIVDSTAAAHPEWVRVDHPDLCTAPAPRFRELFERVGVPWGEAVERFLVESDQAGSGYATQRVAAEERDKWRRRLSDADAAAVVEVVEAVRAARDEDAAVSGSSATGRGPATPPAPRWDGRTGPPGAPAAPRPAGDTPAGDG